MSIETSEQLNQRLDQEVAKLRARLESGSVINRGEALMLCEYIERLRGKPNIVFLAAAGSDPIGANNRDWEEASGRHRPAFSDPGVADNTFTRSDEEIMQRILSISAGDMFGFETMDLVSVLPYDKAKDYLKPSITEAEWQPTARDRKSVIEQMRDYMEFALEKALNHRGLSANRSVNHFHAWLFLLGDDGLLAFAEDDGNYKNYGMPILKAICDKYQFAFPADEAALNMASGKQCEPGCEEGCG